jgi:hypothetical protein
MWTLWRKAKVLTAASKRGADFVKNEFEQFKYGQDVLVKLWAAASTLTFILFFAKDIK